MQCGKVLYLSNTQVCLFSYMLNTPLSTSGDLGKKQRKKEIHSWEMAELTFLELAAYPKGGVTKGKLATSSLKGNDLFG